MDIRGSDVEDNPKAPVAGGPNEDGVLDAEQIDTLREVAAATGNGNLMRNLVDVFTTEAASRLAKLRDAAERADALALEGVAHALRGSSSTMGAVRLAEACAVLEAAGRGGHLDGVAAQLQRLESELERATAALAGEL